MSDLDARVDDLLGRLDLTAKAGLMFHTMASVGDLDAPGFMGTPSVRELLDSGIRHVNVLMAGSAREIAQWHNLVQRECLAVEPGVPMTVSSDPRHAFSDNPMAALFAGPFSQWPEFLGFGALDDEELTRRYADTVRREYLAVGIRTALHPQIDLATEPRWARASGTFGEDVDVVTRHGVAYVRGLQGDAVGPTSVAAMAKHFPGGGPQLDGEDPHFDYGREQVYPGGRFAEHLAPFRAALAAGVGQLMPYYGMPVGTRYEEVGFAFNKQVITELLRGELGFDGIVCTDWGVLTRTCWGVESLTVEQRMLKALDAGVDQFGGEHIPQVLVGLVRDGQLPESRLDVSVRRLLAEKIRLGLFDAPMVDMAAADAAVGAAPARADGLAAQAASVTLLVQRDGPARLPLPAGTRVYLEGVDAAVLGDRWMPVDRPEVAEVAVLRLVAPWEQRGAPGDFESFFHAGSLEFPDEVVAHVREVAARVPTVVDVYLDRPAVLAPLAEVASTLTVNFGTSAAAYARVLSGQVAPRGRLPFDIPSSMAAVVASRPDVAFDTAEPTFRHGDGILPTAG